MKINCGPGKDLARALRRQKARELLPKLKEWHDFFALLPRRIDDYDCRWMETIQRRFPDAFVYCNDSYISYIETDRAEYRAKP